MQIFLFLFCIIFLMAFLKTPKVKGFFGELEVRNILKKLKKDEFEILHNILLEKDGKTTQIDHIIVGRTGIFVVETKNYSGWIFGSEHSKFWTQSFYKSKRRFQNPVHQNYGHIKYLEYHLQDYTGPFFSVIAFGKKGTIKKMDIMSDYIHVVPTEELPRVVHSKTVVGMSTDSVRRVAEMICAANCSGKGRSKKHVQTIQQNIRLKKEKISNNICPKCGSGLIDKIGKYGSFTSCSQYPSCRFTN